jgi:seryl-tRNA synthetase
VLDLKFIRQNPDVVKAGAAKKHIECDVDRVLVLDEEARASGQKIDELRSAQKSAGKAIAAASAEDRPGLLEEQKALKAELKGLEERQGACKDELRTLLLRLPNPPAPEVPEGADDTENAEVRQWGERREFKFEPRDHVELATEQGWLDVETGARLAGSRNYVLFGDLARLEVAVMRYAYDHMVEKGFVPVSVPTLVRPSAMEGTGYFPGGEDQAYRCDERDDLVLVGTAEVPLTSLHAGEILDGASLPLRYVALSTCYRREAGTYGRDTRGLYRVHQFQKVEQVVLDVADDEKSREHHDAILGNSEEVVQAFDIPYRVVNVCGGDLGQGQVQKFDVECWMPGRGAWGETHSASRFHDFQSRRLDMRYRGEDRKTHFVHTLNNTVAASTRMLIALVENHQTEDGRVRVPEPLRPLMGGAQTIGKPLAARK